MCSQHNLGRELERLPGTVRRDVCKTSFFLDTAANRVGQTESFNPTVLLSPFADNQYTKKWILLPKCVYQIALDVFLRRPCIFRCVKKTSKDEDDVCVFDGLKDFLKDCVDALFAVPEGTPRNIFSPGLDKWPEEVPPPREAKLAYLHHAGCNPKTWASPVLDEVRKVTNSKLLRLCFPSFFELLGDTYDVHPCDDRVTMMKALKTQVPPQPNRRLTTAHAWIIYIHPRMQAHMRGSTHAHRSACVDPPTHAGPHARIHPHVYISTPTAAHDLMTSRPCTPTISQGKGWRQPRPLFETFRRVRCAMHGSWACLRAFRVQPHPSSRWGPTSGNGGYSRVFRRMYYPTFYTSDLPS